MLKWVSQLHHLSVPKKSNGLTKPNETTCADVRGGPILIRILFRGARIQRPPKADNYRPVSETPFKWRFTGGPMRVQHWMLAWQLCDCQGIRTSMAKNPFILWFFSGGPDPPPLWIRTCQMKPWLQTLLVLIFLIECPSVWTTYLRKKSNKQLCCPCPGNVALLYQIKALNLFISKLHAYFMAL